MSGRKAPVAAPRIGRKPAPPPAPPRPRLHEFEYSDEEIAARIIGMINRANLTLEQARTIAATAAARASAPPREITQAVHVMAALDRATIDRDEAKLIGIRAIRRAKFIEDKERIFGGPSE